MTSTQECERRHARLWWAVALVASLNIGMFGIVGWCIACEKSATDKASDAIRCVEVHSAKVDEWRKSVQDKYGDIEKVLDEIRADLREMRKTQTTSNKL